MVEWAWMGIDERGRAGLHILAIMDELYKVVLLLPLFH